MVARPNPVPCVESVQATEEAIRAYYADNGILPSIGELVGRVPGVTSKGSMALIVKMLKDAGVLADKDGRLRPGPAFAGFPLGRSLPAGSADTGEVPVERLSIDAWLAPHPAVTRIAPIRGESMINAGLHHGDMVVYEARSDAAVGEIVVALIDEAETIKYLARDAGGLYLLPGNDDPMYQPQRPRHSLTVLGVVVGSFGRRGRATTSR